MPFKEEVDIDYFIKSFRSGKHIISDKDFDKYIYSEIPEEISRMHWTPISIAVKASELLVKNENDKILDIGSGVGKFCIVAASHTNASFIGVEQRDGLYLISEKTKKEFGLTNVKFVNSNIDQISFSDYNAFYYFNPFIENIFTVNRIDDTIPLHFLKYQSYFKYVKSEFKKLPINTRIVTYCCDHEIIPSGYIHEHHDVKNRLSLWVKKHNIV